MGTCYCPHILLYFKKQINSLEYKGKLMLKILVQSESESNNIKDLVSKKLPTYREAYSDRTCFICACLSELA